MIIDNINNSDCYTALHPNLKLGFDFIHSFNPSKFEDGKHSIKGEEVFAIISKLNDFKPNDKLEVHNQYIDLQFIVNGSDYIGWKERAKCSLNEGLFNDEHDYLLYSDKPEFSFTLNKNCFAIFFPNDAHAPLMKNNNMLKIVVKIKV